MEKLFWIRFNNIKFTDFTGNCELGVKEKYFQREVLYHLLELIQFTEGVHPKYSTKPKLDKNAWIIWLRNNNLFFKVQLNYLFTFLISPFQSVEDRVFALHLYVDKTKLLLHAKKFMDNKKSEFIPLLAAFVLDLKELGVTKLNAYNLDKQGWSDYPQLGSYTPSSLLVDPPSMNFVYEAVKKQFGLPDARGNDSFSSEIAAWINMVDKDKQAYELTIFKQIDKIFSNMSLVYDRVMAKATELNDNIIQVQHNQKKVYFAHLNKQNYQVVLIKKRIVNIINELIHEQSIWHLSDCYPQTWALSPFESNNRVRKKLERCFLEIDQRYFLDGHSKQLKCKPFLKFLLDNKSNMFHLSGCAYNETGSVQQFTSSLRYTASVKLILFDEEIDGEILITDHNIRFVSIKQADAKYGHFISKKAFFQDFVISFNEIQVLSKCRYELLDNSLEISLNTGLTYLFMFEEFESRNEFLGKLESASDLLPNLVETPNLITLTQLWRDRHISNYDYLTTLNKLSGRTTNDLMQYPIFPFTLSDYQSQVLDLRSPSSYRIFSRPIAVQSKEREKYYVDQYNYIKSENEFYKMQANENSYQFIVNSAPFHYGSHYSNSGIVLHFLVRLPPYTQMFLQYQDKNFDVPDRAFHSLHTTWRLATEDSTNGFKELIPEFFYLPEFLLNIEGFNFGVRQNGERVNNVLLPPWCSNDARLFTLIHLQALESNYVTQNLNNWIDLTFGFQQSGKPAVDAINVFHPATHFSSDLSLIEDEVKRNAIKTMIKTFGQMPTQLFNMPHPSVSPEASLPIEIDQDILPDSPSISTVIGLKWGNFVGSPIYSKPKIYFQTESLPFDVDRVCPLATNDVLLLPPQSSLMVNYNQPRNPHVANIYMISYWLCIWSESSPNIAIKNNTKNFVFLQEMSILDDVCLCESAPDYNWILVGYRSGTIRAYSIEPMMNVSTFSSWEMFFTWKFLNAECKRNTGNKFPLVRWP